MSVGKLREYLMVGGLATAMLGWYGPAYAGDSHARYYYPDPQTREGYASFAETEDGAVAETRIGFTAGLNAQQHQRGYPPRYHIFAKGAHRQKLIIVAVEENTYNTLYRLRALLAALSSDARVSPLFDSPDIPKDANFLDLCKILGFEQVTVSDGKTIAHRINLL